MSSKSKWRTFFTMDQVAEMMGVDKRTVQRWIEKGKLVPHRVGAVVRISEADLDRFLETSRDF
jgi:excisionase family DNA binding protein